MAPLALQERGRAHRRPVLLRLGPPGQRMHLLPRRQSTFFTCPDGFYKHWWYCIEGTRTFACGECNADLNSCFGGPYACSIAWEET